MNEITIPAPPTTFWQGLRYCRDPRLVLHHVRHSRRREQFVAALVGAPLSEVQAVFRELEQDAEFHRQLMAASREWVGNQPHGADYMYLADHWGSRYFFSMALYGVIRLLMPDLVVETGGTPGYSSSYLLRALDRNRKGTLITVDLPGFASEERHVDPAEEEWYHTLPSTLTSGCVIPDPLRGRHQQVLGDARANLPGVFEQHPQVDVFFHDSDHSYRHMLWEFHEAWPHVRPGGLLLSDDTRLNPSFDEFCQEVGAAPQRLGNLGGIVKPG